MFYATTIKEGLLRKIGTGKIQSEFEFRMSQRTSLKNIIISWIKITGAKIVDAFSKKTMINCLINGYVIKIKGRDRQPDKRTTE